jgi:hypothetical protein
VQRHRHAGALGNAAEDAAVDGAQADEGVPVGRIGAGGRARVGEGRDNRRDRRALVH